MLSGPGSEGLGRARLRIVRSPHDLILEGVEEGQEELKPEEKTSTCHLNIH